MLIKSSRQPSIPKSLPLEGVSEILMNHLKWFVCFKFFTKFIGMIAYIKYRINMIRFLEILIENNIFQINLVILLLINDPYLTTKVMQILY